MEVPSAVVQRPHTLPQALEHPTSNGFHSNTGQETNQSSVIVDGQPVSPTTNFINPPLSPASKQPSVLEEQKPSLQTQKSSENSAAPQPENKLLEPSPPTVSTDKSANATSSSPSNGMKPASGIPRIRPSAIPRLVSHQTSVTSQISQQSNSNNNASPQPNDQLYNSPISLPQTPSSTTNYQPIPQRNSYVEPLNLAEGTQQTKSFYTNGRSRNLSRPGTGSRFDRTASEHPQRPMDNESDTSSAFSSSGPPRQITSKINSLKNVHHKPGGGKVSIVNEKVQLGPISSKCQSLANVKHKPGGGNVVIRDEKLDLSGVNSKLSSLKNIKHVPGGGQTQIVSQKLEFDKIAKSKVGSLKNAQHHPGGGDVQIFREQLPWLKYNKPNLSPEERARINKQHSLSHGDTSSSLHSGSTGR